MVNLKFYTGEQFPLEMHKVRIVQKLNLIPVTERSGLFKQPEPTLFC